MSTSAILNCNSYDTNADGRINIVDLLKFNDLFWRNSIFGDFNHDGACNLIDFSLLADHWGHHI